METDRSRLDNGVMSLSGLIIDTCGWVAMIDAKINLDEGIKSILGKPSLLTNDTVMKELTRLEATRSSLLIDILESRANIRTHDQMHTDDALLMMAKDTGYPVLTVDRRLKERLISEGCSYVEVTSGRVFRLVD
tara:strand:+ start:176 stop:577 length:402 start_codon:yes stop_codon:yes gene_type:complete